MVEIVWRTWPDGYTTGETRGRPGEYISISEKPGGRWRWVATSAQRVHQHASGWASTREDAKRNAEAWMKSHREDQTDEEVLDILRDERDRLNTFRVNGILHAMPYDFDCSVVDDVQMAMADLVAELDRAIERLTHARRKE